MTIFSLRLQSGRLSGTRTVLWLRDWESHHSKRNSILNISWFSQSGRTWSRSPPALESEKKKCKCKKLIVNANVTSNSIMPIGASRAALARFGRWSCSAPTWSCVDGAVAAWCWRSRPCLVGLAVAGCSRGCRLVADFAGACRDLHEQSAVEAEIQWQLDYRCVAVGCVVRAGGGVVGDLRRGGVVCAFAVLVHDVVIVELGREAVPHRRYDVRRLLGASVVEVCGVVVGADLVGKLACVGQRVIDVRHENRCVGDARASQILCLTTQCLQQPLPGYLAMGRV